MGIYFTTELLLFIISHQQCCDFTLNIIYNLGITMIKNTLSLAPFLFELTEFYLFTIFFNINFSWSSERPRRRISKLLWRFWKEEKSSIGWKAADNGKMGSRTRKWFETISILGEAEINGKIMGTFAVVLGPE